MSETVDLGPVMSVEELFMLRKTIGLTQAEMSEAMGLSKSAYVAIETGTATLRKIHQLAAERVALARAAETKNPLAAMRLMPELNAVWEAVNEMAAEGERMARETEHFRDGDGFQKVVRSSLRPTNQFDRR